MRKSHVESTAAAQFVTRFRGRRSPFERHARRRGAERHAERVEPSDQGARRLRRPQAVQPRRAIDRAHPRWPTSLPRPASGFRTDPRRRVEPRRRRRRPRPGRQRSPGVHFQMAGAQALSFRRGPSGHRGSNFFDDGLREFRHRRRRRRNSKRRRAARRRSDARLREAARRGARARLQPKAGSEIRPPRRARHPDATAVDFTTTSSPTERVFPAGRTG